MKYFNPFMSYLTDVAASFLQPIKSQNKIRKQSDQLETKDAQISDLRADRDKFKRRYHVNRDLLADAILERLRIDKHVTDVKFGSQSQGTVDGKQIETAALIHCYVDSYKFDELKMFTASGYDKVDALITLYESLKEADIPEFTNAELKSNPETDEAE